jgi:hypothetical protein
MQSLITDEVLKEISWALRNVLMLLVAGGYVAVFAVPVLFPSPIIGS